MDLITVFAHQLGATPVWHVGNESRLFVALENHELDLVIGGIESATPWNSRIALTLIYYIEEADVGSSRAAALPESVDGITVYYRYGSTYRSNLQNQGAIARPLDRLETGHTPLAAPLWLLESMNLAPLGVHLPSSKYVMAIPPGEHALLMSVERFLLDYASKDRVETLLNRHTNK